MQAKANPPENSQKYNTAEVCLAAFPAPSDAFVRSVKNLIQIFWKLLLNFWDESFLFACIVPDSANFQSAPASNQSCLPTS